MNWVNVFDIPCTFVISASSMSHKNKNKIENTGDVLCWKSTFAMTFESQCPGFLGILYPGTCFNQATNKSVHTN